MTAHSRRCKTCGITKPVQAFRIEYKGRARYRHVRCDCKACQARAAKRYRAEKRSE